MNPLSVAPPVVAPVSEARPATNKWLVTLAISFGSLMGAIDSSIVNVALPQMRGSLGATLEEITWVATGYMMANILVMPLTAFLGSLFGQKEFYLFSFVLFLVGSALCGMAHSLPLMVFFRLIQGFGAGALQPTTQAILRQTFPPTEQGMAMALFAMGVMVGPAVGPTLGGWIVDNYSWPWIFYINLPVGIIGILLVMRFVHEPPDIRAANRARAEKQRRNMDWAGIALLSIGLMAVQYVLEEGERVDWFESRLILGFTLVAVVSLVLVVVHELSTPAPVVNIRLFKDPAFASGTLIGGIMNAMLMANMFLLPVFMQELLGFTATQSGLALMPRVLMMMLFSPIVGRLYSVVQPRIIVGTGILLFAVGAWQMHTFNMNTGPRDIVLALLCQGVGFAALFVPLTTVAIARIPRPLLADASGLNSLLRQMGGSIGLAVFATLLGRYGAQARAAVGTHLQQTDPHVWSRLSMLQGALMGRGLDAVRAQAAALRILAGTVAREATVIAFDRLFLLAGIAFLFVLPLLLFLRNPEGAPVEKVEVHAE